MKFPLSFKIGYRYSRAANGGRFVSFVSLFSIAGITLGVMSLILILSVMEGFEGVLKKRILGAVPHLTISSERGIEQQQLQNTIASQIWSEQVQQVFPLVQSQAIVQMRGDLKGVLAQGVSEQNIPLGIKDSLIEGNWQKLLDKKYGLVLSRYMAMEYGLNIGDKVRILISGVSHYTPIGRLPAQRSFTLVGLFDTQSEIDNQLVLVRASDLNKLMKKPAQANDGFRLVLNDAFDAENIAQQYRQIEPSHTVTSWYKTHGKLFDAVKMEKTMMWAMLSLIILVAAFNIVSALVMMVTQKQGEVAILKTLGLKAKSIRWVFIFQGAYNGFVGALSGAVLGVLLVTNLNSATAMLGINLFGVPGQYLPISLNIFNLVWVFVFAVTLAFLASVYPAHRAASLMPAKVLRHE